MNYIYGLASFIFGYLFVYVVFIPKETFIYGLYNSDDLFSIFTLYIFAIGVTVLLLLFDIQIEHGITTKSKTQLTDKYSHNLGNILQVILATIESLDTPVEGELPSVEFIKKKCLEAGSLINEIRELGD
jgi:hypothetical protein